MIRKTEREKEPCSLLDTTPMMVKGKGMDGLGNPNMETFTYPHFDHHQSVVHVALFLDVSNAKDLRTRIVKASTLTEDAGVAERETVNFAFIDARLVNFLMVYERPSTYLRSLKITSRLHLQTAIYQALLSQSQGILRTKTVHSEIIWALNPSNNVRRRTMLHFHVHPYPCKICQITEALRRYGVSDGTTSLFVVRVASPELQDVQSKMLAVVDGVISPLSKLASLTDWSAIRKVRAHSSEIRSLARHHCDYYSSPSITSSTANLRSRRLGAMPIKSMLS